MDTDNLYVYDNILIFRHLRYPNVLIERPKYVVTINDLNRCVSYMYGCNILPSKSEMRTSILPKRIFEENPSLAFSELKITKETYTVAVNNNKYNIYA